MSEWQPIETAPKDGSWVLCINPNWRFGPMAVARWRAEEQAWEEGCVLYLS